jgi:signal transduction histidine kinase
MKNEIQRLSKFAESFLGYGKPIELNLQKTDIGKIIEDVLELVSAKAKDGNIHISREYTASPELFVDPEFIKTCIYNLIINAFEAMPQGGTLAIKTEKSGDRFSLSIDDTGTGVSEEQMSKIFEPFFTTKSKGLGLGLPLTRRIIEEHGGKVMFEQRDTQGSRITAILPLEKENPRCR